MKVSSTIEPTRIKLTIELGDEVAPVEVLLDPTDRRNPGFQYWEPDSPSQVELPESLALPSVESVVKEMGRWVRAELADE